MPTPSTVSIEQYLQAICRLGGGLGQVRLKEVADDLSVSAASVTEMARRLDELELCRYVPYQGITLTEAGHMRALKLLRKHRLWERFLADRLGLDWDVVHAEAHRLEHATSDDVAERLAIFLGDPETCPHGSPVPGPQGELPRPSGIPLAELSPGRAARVLMALVESESFLAYLGRLGLAPGASVEVCGVDPLDGATRLRIDGRDAVVGPTVTQNVMVDSPDAPADEPIDGPADEPAGEEVETT